MPPQVPLQAPNVNNDDAKSVLRRGKLQRQLYKTRLCTHYGNGSCKYGVNCVFAHDPLDVHDTPDLRKTRVCKSYMAGKCTEIDCIFAHGEGELRSFDWFYKKSLCAWYAKGACVNGGHCRFAHGSHEIRRPLMRKLIDREGTESSYLSAARLGQGGTSSSSSPPPPQSTGTVTQSSGEDARLDLLSRELEERRKVAEDRVQEIVRTAPGRTDPWFDQAVISPPFDAKSAPRPGMVPMPSSLLEANGAPCQDASATFPRACGDAGGTFPRACGGSAQSRHSPVELGHEQWKGIAVLTPSFNGNEISEVSEVGIFNLEAGVSEFVRLAL